MSVSKISIITVNYRKPEITCDLLDSLREVAYPDLEVIVVDNGAERDMTELFRRSLPEVRVIVSRENLGFAGGNNLGIAHATGKYLLFLNNDTLVPPGFLAPLAAVLDEHPRVGIVSPKIYYHDRPEMMQYAGYQTIDPFTGRSRNSTKYRLDDGVYGHTGPTGLAHGACMLVRREAAVAAGGLPEQYFMYYEEIDFCDRVRRAGWEIYYCGAAHIYHRESVSIGRFSPVKTYYLYRNRWLYMRLNRSGISYWFFVAYYLLVGAPWHIFQHLRRKEHEHAKAIMQSLAWNLWEYKKSDP